MRVKAGEANITKAYVTNEEASQWVSHWFPSRFCANYSHVLVLTYSAPILSVHAAEPFLRSR
jgi:hypothetical protein